MRITRDKGRNDEEERNSEKAERMGIRSGGSTAIYRSMGTHRRFGLKRRYV